MIYIFLDIDGVLNCGDTKERFCGLTGIDPDKVKLLKQIVRSTGAKIILTSTWKYGWEPVKKRLNDEYANYLDKALYNEDLKAYAKTDDQGYDRGQGIIDYLQQRPANAWVVLDDNIFNDFKRLGICEHLILTDFDGEGLTQEHVNQAIKMIRDQLESKS